MFSPAQFQLLRLLAGSSGVSRTALARRLGLSKPAITSTARDLIALGVLQEGEALPGESGRPSRPLSIRPSAANVLGIAVAAASACLLRTDLGGEVLERRILRPKGRSSWGPAGLVAAVRAALRRLPGKPPSGIGVALPGLVDQAGRRCIKSTQLGWDEVELADLLVEATATPTRLENDGHALARGLQMFGRQPGDFALISIGVGIGSGHIVGGSLLRGSHGGAGEIAHAPMRMGGAYCLCGKRGCLDTVASLRALAAAAAAAGLPPAPDSLQAAAEQGAPHAVRILCEAGETLGLAVAQMVQTVDPARVIVAAPPTLWDGLYGESFRRTVADHVLSGFAGSRDGAPLEAAVTGDASWDEAAANGAAGVAAWRFLCGDV